MDEKYTIRLCRDSDVDKINQLYNNLYKSTRTREMFNWEFNSAPAGKAIYVVAEYENEIIGTQCVIPYFVITSENETVLSGKSEDTLVSKAHRGKDVFGKMYGLLVKECEQRGIQFIWGFTYATKPFLRLNFDVPFKASMGLAVFKPAASAEYFSSLSPSNTDLEKFKIGMLTFFSWIKCFFLRKGSALVDLDFKPHILNTDTFSYLLYPGSIGLKLDADFMRYRTETNPYSKNYRTVNYEKDGKVVISMLYNITRHNVGFIIHMHLAPTLTQADLRSFLRTCIKTTELGNCHTLRLWAFTHNLQNRKQRDIMSACGFTFLKRGISFVWLNIKNERSFHPGQFVLSRMASQGTD